MKVTPFMVRVLRAVAESEKKRRFSSPSWIASAVFPDDHPGWRRVCKCGPYGSTRGSGLVMMMGGYLGKLHRAKLVYRFGNETRITHEGRKVLEESTP
jgi:hypothetical protein